MQGLELHAPGNHLNRLPEKMYLLNTTVLISLDSLLQVDIFYFRHVSDLDHRLPSALAPKSRTHRRKVPHLENQQQTCKRSDVFLKFESGQFGSCGVNVIQCLYVEMGAKRVSKSPRAVTIWTRIWIQNFESYYNV